MKKKFTKIEESLNKKPPYLRLLIKYNSVCNKYNALIDIISSDLYKEIINGAYKKAEKLEYYQNENIRLRKKLKELKLELAKKRVN